MIETKVDPTIRGYLARGWFPTFIEAGGLRFIRLANADGLGWILRLESDGSIWVIDGAGLVPLEAPV